MQKLARLYLTLVWGSLLLWAGAGTRPAPTIAQAITPAADLPYTIYLPLVSQQSPHPDYLIASTAGTYHFVIERGTTAATWHWLFLENDLNGDGAMDTLGYLDAEHPVLTTTVQVAAGEQLGLRGYADSYSV